MTMGTSREHIKWIFALILGVAGLTGWLAPQNLSVRLTPASNIQVSTPTLLSHAAAQPDQASREQLSQAYGKLPLYFEANRGQTDSQVRFLSRSHRQTLFLTSSEAVLVFTTPSPTATGQPEKRGQTAGTMLRMAFAGSNQQVRVTGLEELPGKANYIIGNDPTKWYTNVPTYGKVRYQDLYPGIDLIYYGTQRQLEYDLVVAPGADPNQIKLAFQGAEDVTVDHDGNLILRVAGGEVRLHDPNVYQESQGKKQLIAARYILQASQNDERLTNNVGSAIQVGIQTAAYDATRPLVIDPVLSYSTYLGGSGDDDGLGIAVDAAGNAYVTGRTSSTGFPTIPGAFQITPAGAFVTKLNPTGSGLVYSTYLGGSGGDIGLGIALGSAGTAYVTGATSSTNFPTTPGAFQTTLNGTSDAFVTKLNATGSALVYSTYLGGSSDDEGDGIAVDSADNAYVTGLTFSANFPTTPGALQISAGGATIFVTKLNAAGSALVYSTYLGGSAGGGEAHVAVDLDGNAYVSGATGSTNFPTTPGAFQTTLSGSNDVFVTKLNPTGSALVYSTYLGGSGFEVPRGAVVDSAGNVYVTGWTNSTDFPTTPGAFQITSGGDIDAFVTKLNPTGSALVYSTYLGGSGSEGSEGFLIAVDSADNAYVTGETTSTNFPTTPGAFQTTLSGSNDAFVTKLNPTGSALVYSTYLGGSSFEGSEGIAVDFAGNAYVTGLTLSTDFPTTSGAFQTTLNGPSDAFIARISPADIVATNSATAAEGQSVTASTAPTMAGQAGVSATLTNNTVGSGPATVTVRTYSANPTAGNIFDAGGGFVDVRVTGADPTDVMTARFYYPSTVTGATEASLQLLYFTGSSWAPVLSSGGLPPVQDTTDNLDGTVSGGRFLVTFDSTSTPQITQLAGTVFTMTNPTLYNFVGFLPPIPNDGSRVFKLGSTVPVKFQLTGASGTFVSTATARLTVEQVSGTTPVGTPIDATPSGGANTGDLFRYDSTSNQYVFNLSTKPLLVGKWQLQVRLDDGTEHTVQIGLR